jgi:hypothetical protein
MTWTPLHLFHAFLAHLPRRRQPHRNRCRPTLDALEDRLLLSTVTWVANGDGFWDVGSNWSTGSVPGPNDDVNLDGPTGSFTITHRQGSDTVHSITGTRDTLAIAGGTLAVTAASQLNGPFDLSGGTLQADGTVTLTGTADQWTTGTLSGASGATNAGTLALGGSENLATTLTNSGTLDFQNDGSLGGSGAVVNTGTIRKSAGTNTFTVSAGLTNQGGTIDVESGTLALPAGTSTGGTLTVAGGATLDLNGGTIDGGALQGTLNNTGTLTITGTLSLVHHGSVPAQWTNHGTIIQAPGSTVQIEGGNDVQGFVHGPSSLSNAAGALYVLQGDAQIQGIHDATGNNPGTLGGDFGNAGTFRKTGAGTTSAVTAVFQDSNGTIDIPSGALQFQSPSTNPASEDGFAGTTITVAPGSSVDLTGGGGSTVSGTLTGSGGGTVSLASGTLAVVAGGATVNFPTGMVQWTGGEIDTFLGTLTNAATGFITLAGPNTKEALGHGQRLVNQGTITQQPSTTLEIEGTTGVQGGYPATTLSNQPGATYLLQGNAGIQGFSSTTGFFSNAGTFHKTGPAATSAVAVVFNDSNGTIDIPSGALQFQSPSTNPASEDGFAGTTFTVAPNASVDLTGGGATTVNGTLTGSGGGTVSLASGTLAAGGGLSGTTFNFPAGLFQWTGGTIDTHNGFLTNAATGFITLTASAPATPTLNASYTVYNQGTITQGPGTTLQVAGTPLQNESGALYVLQGGATVQVQGSFNNAGGTLTGSGTVAGNLSNSGTVHPGGTSPGTLTVTGNYTQTATGTLAVDLGGTTPGSQFDQLAVGSSSTLAGTLTANLVNGFTPGGGDSFPVVTFASGSGTFGTTNVPGLGNGLRFDTAYHGTDASLVVDLAPAFTSAASSTFLVGAADTFTVAASGFPAPALTEGPGDTLPSGVAFNAGTGVLSGMPAAGSGGTYTLHFTAHNGVGSDATQTFTLTVGQPPAFTSGTSATFTVGTAGNFPVTATGLPAPTLRESSSDTLPGGVSFNAATGVLSGTPLAGGGGTYTLHFTAHNGIGSDATQTVLLKVNQPPTWILATGTNSDHATFRVGTAFSLPLAASGSPTPAVSESPGDVLPSGVSFNPATGVLSGMPAPGSGGTYTLHFTAHNGAGADATQTIILTVKPVVTARLVKIRHKKKLMVEVFEDGKQVRAFKSPFQPPAYKNLQLSVRASNSDGVSDQVVLTATKRKKTVTVSFPG